jgi:hypothetical protein
VRRPDERLGILLVLTPGGTRSQPSGHGRHLIGQRALLGHGKRRPTLGVRIEDVQHITAQLRIELGYFGQEHTVLMSGVIRWRDVDHHVPHWLLTWQAESWV